MADDSPPKFHIPNSGGIAGRSGPPGNANARTHGAWTIRRERKELRRRAINGRSSEGRYVAEQRNDIVADLGGADSISTQERWLVDEVTFLRLELAYVRTWLAERPPFNRKKRTAHPILRDYMAMVSTLRALLTDLGLQRRARAVDSLEAECRRTTGASDQDGDVG